MNELEKMELDIRRENKALKFDKEWLENHIPTADRLIKVNGKYQISECPCLYCIKFFEKLKNHV